MTIALAVVMSTFAGLFTGYWLDEKVFHKKTFPWLTIIFFLFGLAGGAKNFFILSKRFSEELDPKKNKLKKDDTDKKDKENADTFNQKDNRDS